MSATLTTGAVVRLPANQAYGTYAIVTKTDGPCVTVNTGTYELIYDRDLLTRYGRFVLGRTYGTTSGNRFAVCTFECVEGWTHRIDVKTREGHDGPHETRALEIRKLAFAQLLRDLRSTRASQQTA